MLYRIRFFEAHRPQCRLEVLPTSVSIPKIDFATLKALFFAAVFSARGAGARSPSNSSSSIVVAVVRWWCEHGRKAMQLLIACNCLVQDFVNAISGIRHAEFVRDRVQGRVRSDFVLGTFAPANERSIKDT